jgi:uncharacterized membrane protein
LYRLLRFIPNNDPIMGVMLPYARQEKWWAAGLFAALTMASFDAITGKVGTWTVVTSLTYGILGIAFHFAFKRMQKNGSKIDLLTYLGSGIIGVLAFDFVTGPVMSSALFGMSFAEAFIGQIPFTAMHLASVSAFVLLLTPVLDPMLVNNAKLEDKSVLKWASARLAL